MLMEKRLGVSKEVPILSIAPYKEGKGNNE